MLQHAAVGAAQDVGEVLALVGAHPRDVRVQARLPAAVAGTAAELDQQLAAVGLAVGLAAGAAQPRLSADVLQVAAHALEVDRGPGDQEDGGGGLVHRADDPTCASAPSIGQLSCRAMAAARRRSPTDPELEAALGPRAAGRRRRRARAPAPAGRRRSSAPARSPRATRGGSSELDSDGLARGDARARRDPGAGGPRRLLRGARFSTDTADPHAGRCSPTPRSRRPRSRPRCCSSSCSGRRSATSAPSSCWPARAWTSAATTCAACAATASTC